MHLQLRRLLLFIFVCLSQQLYSQCTLSTLKSTVCANEPILFTAGYNPSSNAVAYFFDYGDGKTDSIPASIGTHFYTTAGTYSTKVKVYLVGGGPPCVAIGPTIKVNPLPTANFVITSTDTICFKNNQLCLQDLSTPGSVSAAITKRIINVNNFQLIENFPYPNTFCYNNTIDVFGTTYTVIMEVTDANGCVSKLEKKDIAYLTPKTLPPSFRFLDSMHCTNTVVTLINTTTRPKAEFKSFKWTFGDGQFNTTTWTNLKHTYVPPTGSPDLYTTDIFGCIDTALKNPADTILFVTVDSLLTLKTNTSQCFLGNVTRFKNSSKNFVSKIFTFYDKNNKVLAAYNNDSVYSFLECGIYRLNLKVKFADPACNINVDTFIQILGPNTTIHNDTIKPIHGTQCEAHDTIFFISPNPYLSCHSGNENMKWFWNFNDAFAPPCTTDTKHNVNVGVNCRYSVDSIGIKHFYSKDGCYGASLVMMDSLTGCTDRDSVILSLTHPDAGWDSTSNPIRRGLYNDHPEKYLCGNTPVTFYFNELLPLCGFEKLWLNFDSACDKNSWQMMDTLHPPSFYSHFYTSACDTANGWITVGVIVKNGLDKNGNPCYDTAWYHNMLHIDNLIPDFTFTGRPRVGCGAYVVDFKLNDTVQKNLQYVFWDFDVFNAPNVDDTLYQVMNGDSVIKRQTWTYPGAGTYTIQVRLKSYHPEVPAVQCFRSYNQDIALGLFVDAGSMNQTHCVNDTFTLFSQVNYQNSGYQFWADPSRVIAGKELMWWDIGDGKGFFYKGSSPQIKYTKPGTYTIRIATKDSLGCRDTFSLFGPGYIPLIINVYELKAKIYTPLQNLVCAPQIIQFLDSSIFVDSTGAFLTSGLVFGSAIDDTTYWEFGDFKPFSLLANPAHYFSSNGKFDVKLVAISPYTGCRDTVTTQVQLKGPEPNFVIQGDTQGCEPFSVFFNNTTPNKIQYWTWEWDEGNKTTTDTSGNGQTFVFHTQNGQPTKYSIRLRGFEYVFNPSTGNNIPCTSIFPDTITHIPTRDVYVLPSPKLNIIVDDSICPNVEALFKVKSDSLYDGFHWYFGDGDSTFKSKPDTTALHAFAATGSYTLVVIPTVLSNLKCIDTARTTIHVQDVKADFDINDKKSPLFSFINKSSANAESFVWTFGQPSSGSNSSTEVNPSHNYGPQMGEFQICLKAITHEGCWDTICKNIRRDTAYITIPNVFTPDNNDGLNDAFDIDIQGYTKYYLEIYNRWGGRVYESKKDGVGNDGVNWNGKEDNEGVICPAGEYYFIFSYKLITEPDTKIVHGTVTLLRE